MQPIFVGDIQGCGDEFAELVRRAEMTFGDEFALYLVGDLVNRGPRNREVLELARRFIDAGRGEAVLGNHEIGLLEVHHGLREPGPLDTAHALLGDADATEWMDWLRGRPVVHQGQLGATPFVMVHAAVHPSWPLAEVAQQARAVEAELSGTPERAREFLAQRRTSALGNVLGRFVSCRSVGPGDDWSSAEPDAGRCAWHERWSERDHGYGIVYGHWAMQGLHVARGLRGLDTGCVHHGRGRDTVLTAWVPDPAEVAPFASAEAPLLTVPAFRRYYPKD